MSFSFGADLYDPRDPVFRLISLCILAVTFTAAVLMSLTFKRSTEKLEVMTAAVLGIVCFFSPSSFIPVLGYFIFALIMFSITANVLEQQEELGRRKTA
jgi:hypothetical protein